MVIIVTRALDADSISIMEQKSAAEKISQSQWLRELIKKQK